MISDIKKQNLIKDAVLINQQTIKQSSILFTIDITIWKYIHIKWLLRYY